MRRSDPTKKGPRSRLTSDLLSDLIDNEGDEKSGVNAFLGFTYQQWWAALKATDLLATDSDFAIALEVKEDVAVLDSSTAPKSVTFFQVKKHERSGVWSLTELLRQSSAAKVKGPSPLAKLYSRRHALTSHLTNLCFVSNVGFKVPLSGDDSLQFSTACQLQSVMGKQGNSLLEKIAQQLGLNKSQIDLRDFGLERTDLPVGDPRAFVVGRLTILNDKDTLPFKISKPSVVATLLASEVQQRATNNDFADTVDKLLMRCLKRADVTNVFVEAESAGPTTQVLLEAAIKTLEQEGFPWAARAHIELEKVRVCANFSDRTNVQSQGLVNLLSKSLADNQVAIENNVKLGDAMMALVALTKTSSISAFEGVTPGYSNALALLVLKHATKQDKPIATSDPKSEKGP